MKRRPPQLDKPYPRHRIVSAGEKELWHETMGEKSPVLPETEKPKAAAVKEKVKKDHAPAPVSIVTRKKKELPAPDPIDARSLSKIRRGLVSVKAKLDLHGLTKAEAHSAVLHFIVTQQSRGVSLALIITGKGRKGAGALREELPRWLSESPLREAIIAYDVAGPRHGAEGAWYVRIRKKRN